MNGKGSKRRPCMVPKAKLKENWERAFGKLPHEQEGFLMTPPPAPPTRLFCSSDLYQKLKDTIPPTKKPDTRFGKEFLSPEDRWGLQIHCIDDPVRRQDRAFIHAASSGNPVFYENEHGSLLECSIRIAEPALDFIPLIALTKLKGR